MQRSARILRPARLLAAVSVATALALTGCASSNQTGATFAAPSVTTPSSSGTPDGSQGGGDQSGAAGGETGGETATGDATTPAPASVSPAPNYTPPASAKPTGATEEWPDNSEVSHLFFHSLVVNPQVAFKDKESGRGYLDYMVTVDEFTKILDQLYARNYVLVSPHQLGTVDAKGVMHSKKLMVPEGKKPLVISVDDVSYYEYMRGDGFPTKLVVAQDGSVQNEYTDPVTKKTSIGAYDVMPIVDNFVKEHPDFAPYGYKGVIALTGYNGVLGYRSSPSVYEGKNKNLTQDIATATQVANALKASGWEFASHSWGHINFTTSSASKIETDNQRWDKDVEPITGPTDLLVYPFGADISGMPKYSGAKYNYLKDAGYNFYFNVDGSKPSWGQWGKGYLREARFNVDGIAFKHALDGHPALNTFFDVKSVIDPARPASISGTQADSGPVGGAAAG